MKYFKMLDFIMFGMYIPVILIATQHGVFMVFMVLFCMLHFFPVNYLLRKHGYLTTLGDVGLEPTDKMAELVNDLIIEPFKKTLKYSLDKINRYRVIPSLIKILLFSLLVFLLSYFVLPKLLQFPSLDLIYLQCML